MKEHKNTYKEEKNILNLTATPQNQVARDRGYAEIQGILKTAIAGKGAGPALPKERLWAEGMQKLLYCWKRA